MLIKQDSTPDIAMSTASTKVLNRTLDKLAMPIGGCLDIPGFRMLLPAPGTVQPYPWAGGQGERDASSALLDRLKAWVTVGMEPPITNLFSDVQAQDPIDFTVDGAGHFTGLPDMMIAHDGIRSADELCSIVSSAAVVVDWKVPAAFAKTGKIKAIACTHAIALSSFQGYTSGQPVFMTDMATGFRAWIVMEGALYFLNDNDTAGAPRSSAHLLSLEEGVALIRWFLIHEGEYALERKRKGQARQLVLHDDESEVAGSSIGAAAAAHDGSGSTSNVGPAASSVINKSNLPVKARKLDGLISRDVSPGKSWTCDDDFATVCAEIASVEARSGARRLDY